ncbi:hypothetical protein PVAND_009513 [Polypedilum vanderplanki]|uniref:Uncharacterized protein n=1 Tax=Polypedilum vanderplanki TaxID=319348 RepID=A0A9J6CD53_POLVA|nr:hypothetical protein PVAND_009513 [Polypedilum vanderplanki]
MDQDSEVVKKRENINIVNHIAGRLKELKRLYNDVVTTKSDMLVHQMLPNHLRRRAMSHNPKRLPRKYRQAHINQMTKSGLEGAKKKRPSRKYRRRPSNLMKEYNRRKQKNVWLETHVWHAKRFRMKNMWGYRVPFTPTDKRYRASYKGANHHCLVQDISYYSCIEISGAFEDLQAGFRRITSVECGLTLNAKCLLNGTREGNVMIFKTDSYPLHAIARISFLWRPSTDLSHRTIWIFVHPGVYKETLKEFLELFDAKENGSNSKLIRNPKYTNTTSSIEIIELKDTLNRIQLTGPYSSAVLFKTLKLSTNFKNNWTEMHYDENSIYKKAHIEQEIVWKKLQQTTSHLEYQLYGVLGLTVQDPRINRPLKTTKAVNESQSFQKDNYLFEDVPQITSISAIWNKEIRDELIKTKMSNSELCKLRNKNQLVPGIASLCEKDLQPIPILLIQRPSVASNNIRKNAFGSGWDLIIPASYGLHFWLTLVKFGAKPIGLRERYMIMNEAGLNAFDPDSLLGKKEYEQIKQEKTDQYFKLPPNKRTNYTKMKIASPFALPFKQLINEWGSENNEFYLLRNISLLNELDNAVRKRINYNFDKIDTNALIPIYLINEGSRNDSYFNLICLPKKCDIKKALNQKYFRVNEPVFIETTGEDKNAVERKNIRLNHKKALKRLRNRRVRLKRKLQATSEYFVKIQKSNTEKMIEEQFKKMCELWLPSNQPTIRNQCSREVIGYITKSRFCFSEGKVCAIGYVTRNGFKELLQVFQKFKGLKSFVITRNTNSQNYYQSNFIINPQ